MNTTDTADVVHSTIVRQTMKMSLRSRRVMLSSSWLKRLRMTTGWRVCWNQIQTGEDCFHPALSTCSMNDPHRCQGMLNRGDHVCLGYLVLVLAHVDDHLNLGTCKAQGDAGLTCTRLVHVDDHLHCGTCKTQWWPGVAAGNVWWKWVW